MAPVEPPVASLPRSDILAACGTAIVAGGLFLSTFSTHVALGDAPESVAGAKSIGVLHAPGYPSYVAVASLFARVFAFGGWAARVNLFSLVCAALMIGAVSLLARGFGASRAGAALGPLALAASVSFWFNADFAKHYAFSGLLITLAAVVVVHWQSGGRAIWLVVAGVLLGAGAGASWELAAIMTVGLVTLVIFGARRPGAALITASLAALAVVAVGAYAFLIWRARRYPAVSWGEVTDLHRLVGQVTQRDFRSQDVAASQRNLAAKVAIRLPVYVGIIVRDIGLGAAVLALVGAVFGLRGLDRGRKLFLAVIAVLNLLAVAFVAGIDHIAGFLTGIVAGGYVLALLVAIAVLAAVGTAPLLEWATEAAGRNQRHSRSRSTAAAGGERYRSAATVALFAIVLAPSILVHYSYADHHQPPLADRYAQRVLAELPPHAALFVFQADLTFPIVYRQTVFGERPDVNLIVTTSLQFEWYREQIARTLHLASPKAGQTDRQVRTLIDELGATRPVFVDIGMMTIYRSTFPFRLRGLVGEVLRDSTDSSIDRGALARKLLRDDRADGIQGHSHLYFPNGYVYYLYARAHIELAKAYARVKQLEPARTELARSLDDFPDHQIELLLKFSGQPEEKLEDVLRVIEAF